MDSIRSFDVPFKNVSYCNFTRNTDVQEQLRKFWELEEGSSNKAYSTEEKACEEHFLSTFQRNSDGRFVVSIPFKDSLSKLGNSQEYAQKRFLSLEQRFKSNPQLWERYVDFMDEYQSLGHMSQARCSETSSIQNFFPHHGVLKEDSLTTKLRVVFNGSSPTSTGFSLNDLQMAGPIIQNDLISILLRFRQHSYVASADIAKMYRQVLICPEQRPLQSIY